MADWLSYSLADFLPFSRGTYLRLFELHNARFWPAAAIGLGLGLWMLTLLRRPDVRRLQLSLALLALCWLWIAWAFLWETYAPVNWASVYAAGAFAVQGLLLVVVAAGPSRARSTVRTGTGARLGVVLVACAVLVLTVLRFIGDWSWHGLELFGTAPDPTVAATLGLMPLLRSPLRPVLLIVPTLWSLLSGLTLLALGDPLWPVLPAYASVIVAWVVGNWWWDRSRSLPR